VGRLAPMFAQNLIETGMLDSLSAAFTSAAAGVEQSVVDHPWLWIAAITVGLVLLIRPKR
jgi:hypothetical protein